jgi:hypothetical protein
VVDIWLGFLLSLSVFFVGILAMILLWPPRVVELSLDPPEDAHYVQVTDEEERRRILDAQIFYLAWTRNNGNLARRPLWEVVDEWNKQYERYPQYQQWQIRRDDMTATIARYYKTCEPVPLSINGTVEWFVVMPDGRGRCLQPLRDILQLPEIAEEAPEPMVEAPAITDGGKVSKGENGARVEGGFAGFPALTSGVA